MRQIRRCEVNLLTMLLALSRLAAYGQPVINHQAQVLTKESKGKRSDYARHQVALPVSKTEPLVPPPPPVQPSFLSFPNGGVMPWTLDFISRDCALLRSKDLEKQLAELKNQLKLKMQEAKERKDKGDRFEALYAEGVVSRNELTAAKKEAEEAAQELDSAQACLAELEKESTAIHQKLKPGKKGLSVGDSLKNAKSK